MDAEGHVRGGAQSDSQGCDLSTWLGSGALMGEDWCGPAGENQLWWRHCVFHFWGRLTEMSQVVQFLKCSAGGLSESHNNLFSFPYYKRGNGGTERLISWPEDTQLVVDIGL